MKKQKIIKKKIKSNNKSRVDDIWIYYQGMNCLQENNA